MSRHTTFRIGGPADLFVAIRSTDELSQALGALRGSGIPCFILGGGANILVGDRGVRGAVLDLTGMSGIAADSEGRLEALCGTSIDALCEGALALGLEGLENFYGMPGTLGGALFMNARCYETDISDRLLSMRAISAGGEPETLAKEQGQWGYKKSPFQQGGEFSGHILLSAGFGLKKGDGVRIASVMRARKLDRIAKGHYRLPCAGSMFKNNRLFGAPTGALLDRLKLRGYRIGDAEVSPWHANIFVNAGQASARDMRKLVETVMEKARAELGIELEPEVLFVGDF